MHKNRIIIYTTMLSLILIISVPSTIKTINKHNERLLDVTIKKITETAKDCYYNNSCVEDKITLKELYEKTNLEEQANPLSKKVYNKDSYILVSDSFKFFGIN